MKSNSTGILFLTAGCFCFCAIACSDPTEKTREASAFGNAGTVIALSFDPAHKRIIYRVRTRKNIMTYVKVKLVLHLGGKKYDVIHEPFGQEGNPNGILPGAQKEFTVENDSLPAALPPNGSYRLEAIMIDYRQRERAAQNG